MSSEIIGYTADHEAFHPECLPAYIDPNDVETGVIASWEETELVCAECANELGIEGDAFDPELEVQEVGTLPYIQCSVCGSDLTEPAYVEGD